MSSDNVIEFNGKRYDAVTGVYLGKGTVAVRPAVSRAHQLRQGRTIDGVMQGSAKKTAKSSHMAAKRAVEEAIPTPRRHVRHAPGKAADGHKPEHAKTLARSVVHKPTHSSHTPIKLQTPAEVMAAPVSTLARKHSVQQVNPVRLQRSQHVATHSHVRRFAQPAAVARAEYVADLPMHKPPVAAPKAPAKSIDPFEAAMARATSHQHPAPKVPRKSRRHSKAINIMAGLAAFLLIGGAVAYLNKTTIELQLASASAGFSARLPSYKPTGFKQEGSIQNKHGVVAVSFRSGESKFQITQQASNWNSQTLLDSMIGFNKYEQVESKGRTIYLYDGNKAAWVDGGVRFDVTGNAYLDKDELVSLATSM